MENNHTNKTSLSQNKLLTQTFIEDTISAIDYAEDNWWKERGICIKVTDEHQENRTSL
jgi:hypothetical protein